MRIKRKKSENKDKVRVFDIRVLFLSAMFLCGVCAGCITASYITGDGANLLNEYISKGILVSEVDTTGKELFFKAFITFVKYPAIIFLLGYTAFGILFIPLVLVLRGYFISFCVTSVIQALGYKGILSALCIYGFQAVISIPCILIVAAKAMRASQGFFSFVREEKDKRMVSPLTDGYLTCFLICIVFLAVCAAVEAFLIPKLSVWSHTLIF